MARARTERVGGALYFTDSSGTRWRVHDCYIGAFRRLTPAPWGPVRVFVSETGERPRCEMGPDERDHRPATLARQLGAARILSVRNGRGVAVP